eukprot:scaffold2739_cov257-Pinguiococcus_pyrenoidosus.AAC.30
MSTPRPVGPACRRPPPIRTCTAKRLSFSAACTKFFSAFSWSISPSRLRTLARCTSITSLFSSTILEAGTPRMVTRMGTVTQEPGI